MYAESGRVTRYIFKPWHPRPKAEVPGENYSSNEPNEAAYIILCILSGQNIRPSQVQDRIPRFITQSLSEVSSRSCTHNGSREDAVLLSANCAKNTVVQLSLKSNALSWCGLLADLQAKGDHGSMMHELRLPQKASTMRFKLDKHPKTCWTW